MKVGVTGDLPPMDYVAPDGRFAGFNTAVLAEIGKRMQRNIKLVQVDSIGRALALSEGVSFIFVLLLLTSPEIMPVLISASFLPALYSPGIEYHTFPR